MHDTFDVICAGTALVDSIIKGFDPKPVSESGYRALSGTLHAGGEAVNASVAAAKLGLRAAILCALGRDGAGDLVEAALVRGGVDTRFVLRGAQDTPVTTMFVADDGTRKSVTNAAHGRNFHPERHTACFAHARMLLIGSLFRAPFDDPQIVYEFLRKAKDAGLFVIADTKLPNFRFLTPDDLRDSFPLIDCITPNRDEAAYYTGESEPEAMADAFLKRGVKSVIVKLGGEGCFFKDAGRAIRLPAFEIDAQDATGAGDNFAAGYASVLLRGGTVGDALRFANACGAICTTAVGAGAALQSREQVEQFLRTAKTKE